MNTRLTLGVVTSLLLGGCTTFKPPMQTDHPPTMVAAQPFPPGRVPVALVLSGGSARGFAHVGVIKVLEANGLRPDIIVGTSAGAIAGALYASGLTAAELESAIGQMDKSVFTDFVVRGLGILPGELGVVRGDNLHRFLGARLKRHHIQDFPIRFAAVATDLSNGKPVALNSGDAGLAVLASSAVPGVITPVLRKTSGQFAFADRGHLIAAGEQAALQMLPEIRSAFAKSALGSLNLKVTDVDIKK